MQHDIQHPNYESLISLPSYEILGYFDSQKIYVKPLEEPTDIIIRYCKYAMKDDPQMIELNGSHAVEWLCDVANNQPETVKEIVLEKIPTELYSRMLSCALKWCTDACLFDAERRLTAARNAQKGNMCLQCGSVVATSHVSAKLKVCGTCRSAAYCSEDCQKAGWKEHKLVCSALAQQRENAKAGRI